MPANTQQTASSPPMPFTFGNCVIPEGCRRILITAELKPSNDGTLIQPTGFPDLGPVFYPDPSGNNGLLCLVESEPSMANRLEEVCFANKYEGEFKSIFSNVPYLRAERAAEFITASTIDGHRFASDFLVKGKARFENNEEQTLGDFIITKLGLSTDGKKMPIANIPNMFPLVFELDTMSLIHGFQISNEKISFVGLRMPRALTASIVAFDCTRVTVPGIKFNPGQVESASGQAIFQKPRIVAKKIEARFSIDVGLLSSLRLVFQDSEQNTVIESARCQLLISIALWKIAAFLDLFKVEHSLRTECKLKLKNTPQFKAEGGTTSSDGNFDYTDIKKFSFQQLIADANFPAGRSPLTLQF